MHIELLPEKNPLLSALTATQYKQKVTEVPNKALPSSIKGALSTIYFYLTGESLEDDTATILVASENGFYKRTYTPKIYLDGDNLIIKWGSELITLNFANQSFTTDSDDEANLDFTFASEDRGFGDELVLTISAYNDETDEVTTLNIPTGLVEESQLNAGAANALLKKSPTKLLEHFRPKPLGTTYNLRDLEVGEYQVTDYQMFTVRGSGRIGYKILVQPNEELGLNQQVYCFANAAITPVLASDPPYEITTDKPARLIIHSKRELPNNRGVSVKCNLIPTQSDVVQEDALNLSFI